MPDRLGAPSSDGEQSECQIGASSATAAATPAGSVAHHVVVVVESDAGQMCVDGREFEASKEANGAVRQSTIAIEAPVDNDSASLPPAAADVAQTTSSAAATTTSVEATLTESDIEQQRLARCCTCECGRERSSSGDVSPEVQKSEAAAESEAAAIADTGNVSKINEICKYFADEASAIDRMRLLIYLTNLSLPIELAFTNNFINFILQRDINFMKEMFQIIGNIDTVRNLFSLPLSQSINKLTLLVTLLTPVNNELINLLLIFLFEEFPSKIIDELNKSTNDLKMIEKMNLFLFTLLNQYNFGYFNLMKLHDIFEPIRRYIENKLDILTNKDQNTPLVKQSLAHYSSYNSHKTCENSPKTRSESPDDEEVIEFDNLKCQSVNGLPHFSTTVATNKKSFKAFFSYKKILKFKSIISGILEKTVIDPLPHLPSAYQHNPTHQAGGKHIATLSAHISNFFIACLSCSKDSVMAKRLLLNFFTQNTTKDTTAADNYQENSNSTYNNNFLHIEQFTPQHNNDISTLNLSISSEASVRKPMRMSNTNNPHYSPRRSHNFNHSINNRYQTGSNVTIMPLCNYLISPSKFNIHKWLQNNRLSHLSDALKHVTSFDQFRSINEEYLLGKKVHKRSAEQFMRLKNHCIQQVDLMGGRLNPSTGSQSESSNNPQIADFSSELAANNDEGNLHRSNASYPDNPLPNVSDWLKSDERPQNPNYRYNHNTSRKFSPQDQYSNITSKFLNISLKNANPRVQVNQTQTDPDFDAEHTKFDSATNNMSIDTKNFDTISGDQNQKQISGDSGMCNHLSKVKYFQTLNHMPESLQKIYLPYINNEINNIKHMRPNNYYQPQQPHHHFARQQNLQQNRHANRSSATQYPHDNIDATHFNHYQNRNNQNIQSQHQFHANSNWPINISTMPHNKTANTRKNNDNHKKSPNSLQMQKQNKHEEGSAQINHKSPDAYSNKNLR